MQRNKLEDQIFAEIEAAIVSHLAACEVKEQEFKNLETVPEVRGKFVYYIFFLTPSHIYSHNTASQVGDESVALLIAPRV
jgi:hypothetical protein